MPRGTAKFETMKMVDVKSSERKIPNNKPIDIDMNDKMRLEDKKDVKLVEIDPLRSINKGLDELDDSIETKGLLNFEKSPILNTLKKVGNTKPIKGAAKYGTIGATGYFTLKPEDVKVKAMDVGKLAKVAIPAVAGGFIASDTANRLQDRRAKKRDDGIVEEIVERLKTNRE